MRLACLQFAPELGKRSSNVDRANAILEASCPRDLDLLVLPELSFAGYNHPSFCAIKPHLEDSSHGDSTRWAKATAARLDCIVTIGYAELSAPRDGHLDRTVAHNASVTVSPMGDILAHYRKTHLYYTDETWAEPSPSGWLSTPLVFSSGMPAERTVNTSFGICMDLNPHKFQAPWDEYEFASHVVISQSDVVILSMAWISSLGSSAMAEAKEDPDLETLNYWIERLRPLRLADKDVLVVCANRCGDEPGTCSEDRVRYAGSSWIGLVGKEEVRIWGILGRGQEDVLVVDTTEEPKWVLHFQSEGDDMGD